MLYFCILLLLIGRPVITLALYSEDDNYCMVCKCTSIMLDCRDMDLTGFAENLAPEEVILNKKLVSFAGSTGLNMSEWLSCKNLINLESLDLRRTNYNCQEARLQIAKCDNKGVKVIIF